MANLLLDTAEMPLALLFFGAPLPACLGTDAALTVITMAGLRLPDLKIEREYWSAEEALALPMLHTAHGSPCGAATRRHAPAQARRLDEAHFMEGWRSGRSFLVRLARDSRKWNLAGFRGVPEPEGHSRAWTCRTSCRRCSWAASRKTPRLPRTPCGLLRVPTDVGYEAVLASLSAPDASSTGRLGYREFVLRDVDSRVQRVRIDVSYVDGLLSTLDTTPTGQAARK
jgi:hypothetical protein